MLNSVLAALLVVATAMVPLPAAAQGASPAATRIKAAKAIIVAYSPDSPPFSATGAGGAGYSITAPPNAPARVLTQVRVD
jgi:ABC-type amino acid transport substrate-binding protein